MPESKQPYPAASGASRTGILLAFLSLYICWGSTYLAIRVGDASMPQPLFAGVRFLIAGPLLLFLCRLRGMRLRITGWPLVHLILMSILMLGGGNLGVVYAERHVPSGLTALLLAVTPLTIAIIEIFLPHGDRMPAKGWMGIALGIVGMAALVWPSLCIGMGGDKTRIWALLWLLAGSFSWTIGSFYLRWARLPLHPFVAAGYQMFITGVFDTSLGSSLGLWREFQLTRSGVGALAYLITGGSLLGYTSYIYLIEHVPISKVSSYTYVNPVIAVLLGIALIGERPEGPEWLGMGIIVVAVFLLTTAQMRPKQETSPQEAP